MTNQQTTNNSPAVWILFVAILMGFIVNLIDGPETAVDWITLIAMFGGTIGLGLTLRGRMRPK